MPRQKIIPTCHPERKHASKGKCESCYQKEWRRRDPERRKGEGVKYWHKHRTRLLELRKVWRDANRERVRQWSRESYRRHPETQYKRHLKETYGMTLVEYHRLVAMQNGACLICGTTEKRLGVDHDHATGLIRGLLCIACNAGMGNLGDNPERLEAAARYLRRVRAYENGQLVG